MSWNPTPTIGSASWQGNAPLVTKNQLLSTTSGLYADLEDFSISSLTVSTVTTSTLTVLDWISAPILYVSTIRADNLDVSGVVFDASGLLYAPTVSSTQGIFNITNISVMQMTFKPTFTGAINVSFDLGLGEAIGGFLAGLGAAVGGGLIAVGTGAGLAIQGAEQGIATIIAGRPQNFITNNTYETINFTSQLQVSTLGDAEIAYSSIFRTVSSSSANTVPGREIFTSTIFYPGQICIRSASDPINLITGDSNLNTSTIQSFGQWVPLEGLEPENIIADSVSTNKLSTGNLFASLAQVDAIDGYSGAFSNAGFAQSASLNYQAPLIFQLGATNQAAFVGDLNRLYYYNDVGTIFSGGSGNQESASLYLGPNTNESIFNVSSIYSVGNIKTVDFYASSITAEQITAVSTIFITSTNLEVITSTVTLNADNIYGKFVTLENLISSVNFTTQLGNPTSPYDINRVDSVVSTSYASVSSLTQNILNYTLNAKINEQTTISPWTPQAEIYTASPTNVNQWGSTMLYCDPGADIGGALYFTYPSSFFTIGLTGVLDLTVDMRTQPFSFSAAQYVGEVPGQGYNEIIPFISPTTGFLQTYRLTCGTNGIWSYITPAPPPPVTENSNVFTISQDINDTYITATDRLHLQAGDILFDGTLNLANVNLDTLNVDYLNVQTLANVAVFSSLSTFTGQPTPQISHYWTSNYTPPSALSSITNTLSTSLLHSVFDAIVNRPNIYLPMGSGNDFTLSRLGYWLFNGVPRTDNYALGTITVDPVDGTCRIFTDNNGFGLASNLQVVNLSNASAFNINLFINFPSTAIPIPAGTATSIYWNNTLNTFQQITYAPWPSLADPTEVDITQGYNWFQIASPSTIFNSNVTIGGTLSMTGKTITTFQMTWSHEIGIASQHDFGTVPVQDGNGNSYNSADWRMELSIYQIELNSVAYAMNSFSMRPNTDGAGNYTISWDTYYTTVMLTSFDIGYWVNITMYPREMVDVPPPKNWGLVS